jgi:perosamine synthetase
LKNIPYGRHFVDEDDVQAVAAVMRGGMITQGPKPEEFEHAIAEYVGAKYAVAVSNGTAALHIANAAAGFKPGDKVITSPNTFVASANGAVYVGADPDFADIDPETLNLDPKKLAARCAELENVRGIVPVHFGGLPCDMPAIRRVAQRYGATVIEDAAHAIGAVYPDGTKVGSCTHSDMTTFSFHPVKLMTSGEGGMVTTNDASLYRDLLRLRSHGINKLDDPMQNPAAACTDGERNPWYYEMQEVGFNYRITDIQAALGLSQFRKLDRFLARRKALAARYDAAWESHPLIKPMQTGTRERNALHLYVVRIDFRKAGTTRQRFMTRLIAAGITPQVHYIPVHTHPFYARRGFERGQFPAAEAYYEQALSLPLFYGLSDEEQSYVVETIEKLLG